MTMTSAEATRAQVAEAIRQRQRFVVVSHARPDGDAIGSALAMAYALRHLGKDVRVLSRDAPPPPFMVFPGVPEIEILARFAETSARGLTR